MSYRPSQDGTIQRVYSNPLWTALETIYDNAIDSAPLPRHDPNILHDYVRERRIGDRPSSELLSRLPVEFSRIGLGVLEADVLDFVLNYSQNRVLALLGTRGVGKSTLLHFVETAVAVAMPERPHLFVKLDGLQLNNRPTAENFAELLHDELVVLLRTAPAVFHEGMQAAIETLEAPGSMSGDTAFRRAARDLADHVPDGDPKRTCILFDNLDQLHGESVDIAMQLARQTFTASRLGTIVALRPGSLRRISSSNRAAAFIEYKAEVTPPRLPEMLDRFSRRLAVEAEAHEQRTGQLTEIAGAPLTAELVTQIFERFAKLMRNRPPGDDATKILEEVSASDTRQMTKLLRRILSHRSLPVGYLLGNDSLGGQFHALTAMMEGPRPLYEDTDPLPNLLWSLSMPS